MCLRELYSYFRKPHTKGRKGAMVSTAVPHASGGGAVGPTWDKGAKNVRSMSIPTSKGRWKGE